MPRETSDAGPHKPDYETPNREVSVRPGGAATSGLEQNCAGVKRTLCIFICIIIIIFIILGQKQTTSADIEKKSLHFEPVYVVFTPCTIIKLSTIYVTYRTLYMNDYHYFD